MKQQTLTGFEKFGKTTRRAQFLADMERVIQKWPRRLRQRDKWRLRLRGARISLSKEENHEQAIAPSGEALHDSGGGSQVLQTASSTPWPTWPHFDSERHAFDIGQEQSQWQMLRSARQAR
jgi:hypothetical protein